jgi:hypothetical protein
MHQFYLHAIEDFRIGLSKFGKNNRRLMFGGAAWLLVMVLGTGWICAHSNTPGVAVPGPQNWPRGSRISVPVNGPVLVMFAHPQCPCTQATMGELEQLMADCQGRLEAQVWFVKPPGTAENWTNTGLWRAAARIPGVTVYCDANGVEARRFNAVTSGETLLYDQEGHLLFQGGITISRGHVGDNPGLTGLETLVEGKSSVPIKTPVFGCSLFGDQCRQNKGATPW